jgi:hypothetical protein
VDENYYSLPLLKVKFIGRNPLTALHLLYIIPKKDAIDAQQSLPPAIP